MLINAEFTMQSTNRSGGSLARICNIGASPRISSILFNISPPNATSVHRVFPRYGFDNDWIDSWISWFLSSNWISLNCLLDTRANCFGQGLALLFHVHHGGNK